MPLDLRRHLEVQKLVTELRVSPIRMKSLDNHMALNAAALFFASALLVIYTSVFTLALVQWEQTALVSAVISLLLFGVVGFIASLIVKEPPIQVSPEDGEGKWLAKWISLFLTCLIASVFLLIIVSVTVDAIGFGRLIGIVDRSPLPKPFGTEFNIAFLSAFLGCSFTFACLHFGNKIVDGWLRASYAFLYSIVAVTLLIHIIAFVVFSI